jgi:hypothetical protein
MSTRPYRTRLRRESRALLMLAASGLAALALTGCATKWTKPGGSEQQFYSDRYQCEQEAAGAYQAAPTQIMTSPGYSAPQQQQTQTNCYMVGNQMTCNSQSTGVNTAMYNRPPTYATVDANSGNRTNAVRSCLMARGYSPSR